MGEFKEGMIDIVGWLKSDREYNTGVLLYQKFGKNKTLQRLFPGKEKRYANKLAIELAKTAGISLIDFQNNNFGDVPTPTPPKGPVASVDNTSFLNTEGRPPLIIEQAANDYPPMIRKMLHLYNALYQKRSLLHKEMGDIPQNNDPIHVDKRKAISDQLELISSKLDILYNAKKNYIDNKVLPEDLKFEEFEAVLNGVVKTKAAADKKNKKVVSLEEMSQADLLKKRTNTRTSLTKQKNMLEYQHTSAKNREPKPMPEGPKKQKVLDKISEIEKQLSKIDTLLDADKTK